MEALMIYIWHIEFYLGLLTTYSRCNIQVLLGFRPACHFFGNSANEHKLQIKQRNKQKKKKPLVLFSHLQGCPHKHWLSIVHTYFCGSVARQQKAYLQPPFFHFYYIHLFWKAEKENVSFWHVLHSLQILLFLLSLLSWWPLICIFESVIPKYVFSWFNGLLTHRRQHLNMNGWVHWSLQHQRWEFHLNLLGTTTFVFYCVLSE